MAFLPVLATAAAVYQGVQSRNAATTNASVMGQEQKASVNQATAQENIQRRTGREMLGRQQAAFGAAGVGYGGSSETALDTSAVNQELDALNTRYKGQFTGYGYGVQSGLDRQQANQYGVLAGSALLKGIGANYSYSPQSPSQMSGLTTPGSQ